MNVVFLSAITLLFLTVFGVQRTHAFGFHGHRVAGQIAAVYLCTRARTEVDRLAEGESLAELGLWADRVRTVPPWDDSGPWHYLNIADGMSLASYQSPPEGDVLWAISHFRSRLADRSLGQRSHTEALRFLVHFIVDLHQPLHVGRLIDRGGTTTEVLVGDEEISLHRFWDTDSIPNAGLSAALYASTLTPMAESLAAEYQPSGARQWAMESLAVRRVVYDFDQDSGRLDADYQRRAGDLVQLRLIQAGLRLAEQLNRVYCPSGSSLGP